MASQRVCEDACACAYAGLKVCARPAVCNSAALHHEWQDALCAAALPCQELPGQQRHSHAVGCCSPLQLVMLHLLNDPCVEEAVDEGALLAQHGHGGPVALDGLEALRGLHLPLYDEVPDLPTGAGSGGPSVRWSSNADNP